MQYLPIFEIFKIFSDLLFVGTKIYDFKVRIKRLPSLANQR